MSLAASLTLLLSTVLMASCDNSRNPVAGSLSIYDGLFGSDDPNNNALHISMARYTRLTPRYSLLTSFPDLCRTLSEHQARLQLLAKPHQTDTPWFRLSTVTGTVLAVHRMILTRFDSSSSSHKLLVEGQSYSSECSTTSSTPTQAYSSRTSSSSSSSSSGIAALPTNVDVYKVVVVPAFALAAAVIA
ncbi:hypothetical protein MRB53_037456 [Persea americana]|nr:hypothetical protein MRB53_037456 [Persea americana]